MIAKAFSEITVNNRVHVPEAQAIGVVTQSHAHMFPGMWRIVVETRFSPPGVHPPQELRLIGSDDNLLDVLTDDEWARLSSREVRSRD